MKITFLRHATAEDRALGVPDADRILTEKGEMQINRIAAFCKNKQLTPKLLLTSPVLRAKQTATRLHERLPGCPYPQTAPWLGLETSPFTIIAELAKLDEQNHDDVWLVGHEPDFSATIGLFLQTDSANILIKKASITRLEADFTDEPTATLLWSIPCSLLP